MAQSLAEQRAKRAAYARERRARLKREAEAEDGDGDEAVALGYGDETSSDDTAETAPRRGRGRPRGSGGRGKVDLSGMEQLLYAVHIGLASVLKTPELVISEAEAALLRGAAEKVARHYDLPDLPAKAIDWTNLIVALGTVYGSRVIAVQARLAAARSRSKPEAAPMFHGVPSGAAP